MTRRGHRIVEHTADQGLEAWGATRAVCLEEAVAGLVAQFAEVPAGLATEVHEFAVVGRDGAAVLLAVLEEVVFLLDARGVVPAAVTVADDGDTVRARFDLVDAAAVAPTGPAPKGVSLSGLALALGDDGWRAHALIDI
jgi:SHS2 domain-containing protein